MRKMALVVLSLMLVASVFAGTASAAISFGTRNFKIESINLSGCNGSTCDVKVPVKITVRNSGDKDIKLVCPFTVHRENHGPVAWGAVDMLVKAGHTNTLTFPATGNDTINQSWSNKKDVSKYWVRRGVQGTPQAPVVECIQTEY